MFIKTTKITFLHISTLPFKISTVREEWIVTHWEKYRYKELAKQFGRRYQETDVLFRKLYFAFHASLF